MKSLFAPLAVAFILWMVIAPSRKRVSVNPSPLYKRPAPPIPAPVSRYLH